MSIAIIAPGRDLSMWLAAFGRSAPQLAVEVWPDIKKNNEVTCAIVWHHPPGCLQSFPKLKLICSMGAGADHVLSDPNLPAGVPITRVIDQHLAFSMSNYVVAAVLYHHKMYRKFIADKAAARWAPQLPSENPCTIGILGFGVLGQEAGRKLKTLGFEVVGFSNSRKEVKGFECFAGMAELDLFLKKINVMVCLLPATPETRGILSKPVFDRMNRGTYLINAARGAHQVTGDIINAIDSGQLSGAFLDVFENEPLPENHPAWKHPKIMITPHIASITNPETVVPQMLENYQAALKRQTLRGVVDRMKGY